MSIENRKELMDLQTKDYYHQILEFLLKKGKARNFELLENLGMSKSTLSDNCRKLEEKKFISKNYERPEGSVRDYPFYYLTDEGRSYIQEKLNIKSSLQFFKLRSEFKKEYQIYYNFYKKNGVKITLIPKLIDLFDQAKTDEYFQQKEELLIAIYFIKRNSALNYPDSITYKQLFEKFKVLEADNQKIIEIYVNKLIKKFEIYRLFAKNSYFFIENNENAVFFINNLIDESLSEKYFLEEFDSSFTFNNQQLVDDIENLIFNRYKILDSDLRTSSLEWIGDLIDKSLVKFTEISETPEKMKRMLVEAGITRTIAPSVAMKRARPQESFRQILEMGSSKQDFPLNWILEGIEKTLIGSFDINETEFDEKIEKIVEKLRLKPKDIKLNLLLANIYLKRKNYKDAIEILNKIPTSKLKKDELAKINFFKAEIYFQSKEYNKAINFYKKILKAYPDYHEKMEIWYKLGCSFYYIGDKNNSNIWLSKIVKLTPFDTRSWYLWSRANCFLDNYEKAINGYYKTLKLNKEEKTLPEYLIFGMLSIPLALMDKREDAIKCIKSVINSNPNDIIVWCNIGLSYSSLGENEKAIRCFKKALELDPKFKGAWYDKGVVLGQLDRHEEELEAYEKALELDPNFKEAWVNKGVTLGQLNRYEEELEAYEKALELDPNYKDAWYNKGVTLGKLDRYEEA
ncbi:MAG: tetratricopeptide repeat protein, partial [Candidatus Helarchaeota archaeon]